MRLQQELLIPWVMEKAATVGWSIQAFDIMATVEHSTAVTEAFVLTATV